MLITFDLDSKEIRYLLMTAFEQGIGYWAKSVQMVNSDDEGLYDAALRGFGVRPILRTPEDVKEVGVIDIFTIPAGLAVMAKDNPYLFGRLVSERGSADCTVADAFVQYVVFGKLVYG